MSDPTEQRPPVAGEAKVASEALSSHYRGSWDERWLRPVEGWYSAGSQNGCKNSANRREIPVMGGKRGKIPK